jgi:Transposase DDE domain group 1
MPEQWEEHQPPIRSNTYFGVADHRAQRSSACALKLNPKYVPKYILGDSAFALPNLLRLLEKEGFRYAIRLKSNPVLQRKIAYLLQRPVGRPSRQPKKFHPSFRYRAGSWDQARRVVAKVEWHAGELFPRVGFLVTNLKWRCKRVVQFYNARGTAEQWIKEGKMRSSGPSCRAGVSRTMRRGYSCSL